MIRLPLESSFKLNTITTLMPLRLLPYRSPQPHYHLLLLLCCCHRTRTTTFTSCQQEARGGRSWEKVTERGKLQGLVGTAHQPPQRQRHCFHTLVIFWQDIRFAEPLFVSGSCIVDFVFCRHQQSTKLSSARRSVKPITVNNISFFSAWKFVQWENCCFIAFHSSAARRRRSMSNMTPLLHDDTHTYV